MHGVILAALLLMFGAGAVESQEEKGVLHGLVSDRSEEGLSGAIVVLTGSAQTAEMVTAADETGAYRLADLPSGSYEVRVSHIGFKTAVQAGVVVEAGQETQLDFILQSQVIFLEQSVVSASRRHEKILDAPASVSVVEGSDIRNIPVLSVADHIQDLPAVDFAKTGLVQSNVVVRGFNNVFSGSMLTLTDNRLARVPSLRLNAYNFIPVTNDDVERIEVVLGPGRPSTGPTAPTGSCTSSPIPHLPHRVPACRWGWVNAAFSRGHCGTLGWLETAWATKFRPSTIPGRIGSTMTRRRRRPGKTIQPLRSGGSMSSAGAPKCASTTGPRTT